MTADELIAAFELPQAARVEQRVPKKLLIENAAPTAADKRQINEGIETVEWVAALKPATVGVAEYRDEVREIVEIALLRATLRGGAKETRIVELIHRAVPYPLLLVTEGEDGASLSLAQKRWSQSEAGATVLDGEIVVASAKEIGDDSITCSFRAALALMRQTRTNLGVLYDAWIHTVISLRIARVNGVFAVPGSAEHATLRRQALDHCMQLEREMSELRSSAAKVNQVARQAELNLKLQRLRAEHEIARARL